MNIDELHKVNDEVNGVKYEPDKTNSGTKDNWYTPKEFYENGSGDCEDFAIAKYYKLKSMGYSPEDMRISHVKLSRGKKGNPGEGTASGGDSEAHMVLIVNGMVLDNLPDTGVKSFDERKDLAMVYQFNEDNMYVNDKEVSGGSDNITKWGELKSRIDEEDMVDDYETGGV